MYVEEHAKGLPRRHRATKVMTVSNECHMTMKHLTLSSYRQYEPFYLDDYR
jgi:hypothetical protein